MLSAIAEAAIQLPDDDAAGNDADVNAGPGTSSSGSGSLLEAVLSACPEQEDAEVSRAGVKLLMQQRRHNMAEVHDDLFKSLSALTIGH